MTISLYDISVLNYLQVLRGMISVLAKGEEYAAASDLALARLVESRLAPDMLPFSFQVISVSHHSLGAIQGISKGLFGPPPSMRDPSYRDLQKLLSDTTAQLQALAREEVDALQGRAVKFKAGNFELPFTAENFVLSFSLPNFYFHATTAYDILRNSGVPLGKMDFLGAMRVSE